MYKEAREAAIKAGSLSETSSDKQTISVLRDGFAAFGPKYKVSISHSC